MNINLAVNFFFPVPQTSIATSIAATRPPVAGYNFTLTCTVVLADGLLGVPQILWLDPNGQPVSSAQDVTLAPPVTSAQTTNQSIYFDPIRTSDGGAYMCMAMVSSSALATTLNSSASFNINVQQSKFVHIWPGHQQLFLQVFQFL